LRPDHHLSFRKSLLDRSSVFSFLRHRLACENYPHFSSSRQVLPDTNHHRRRLPHPRRHSAITATATITMAQVRDASFNPTSPHSSSGGADSFKQEGTPDTRFTIFSPEDHLARSNKLLNALNLDGPSDHAIRFRVKPAEGFGGASADAAADKDPFISSTTIKAEHKLSPTASAFRPVSVPLVAHGSLNVPPGLNPALGANRQLFPPQAAAKFSSELGISRCVVLYSPTHPVTVTDVEGYLAVRLVDSPFPLDDLSLTTHTEVGATWVAVPG
jgi:hypothetical protein